MKNVKCLYCKSDNVESYDMSKNTKESLTKIMDDCEFENPLVKKFALEIFNDSTFEELDCRNNGDYLICKDCGYDFYEFEDFDIEQNVNLTEINEREFFQIISRETNDLNYLNGIQNFAKSFDNKYFKEVAELIAKTIPETLKKKNIYYNC